METGGTKREGSAPYPVPRMAANTTNNTGVDSGGGGLGSPMSGYGNQVRSGWIGQELFIILFRESPPQEQCPHYLWTIWTSWAPDPAFLGPLLGPDLPEVSFFPCPEDFTREPSLCKTLRWPVSAPACPQPDLRLLTLWPDR